MRKSTEDTNDEVPVVKSRRGRKQKQQHVINENIAYLDHKTIHSDVKGDLFRFQHLNKAYNSVVF